MRELRQTSCIGVLQALQIDSVINDKAVPRQAEGKNIRECVGSDRCWCLKWSNAVCENRKQDDKTQACYKHTNTNKYTPSRPVCQWDRTPYYILK